jgi:hypothetical protein
VGSQELRAVHWSRVAKRPRKRLIVEDDVFRASVTVLGKMDYDTQIGGNTTVPLLEVNSIKVIG